MFCPQCGAPSAEGAQFCAVCGAAMTVPDAPVERSRPPLITILAVLDGLAALWWLAVGLLAITASHRDPASGFLFPVGVFCLVISLFAAVCLVGMWSLRPFGRYMQIVFAIIGLVFFPVGTLISILILVYMFNPGVRVLYSQRPVETMTPQERAHVRALKAWSTGALVIGIVAGLLVVVAMTGVMAAIAIPNLLNAIDRGKQKRTMADMRTIAVAIEAYRREFNDQYPSVTTIGDLQQAVEPRFIKSLPVKDGWNNDFVLESSPTGYTILSHGKDGAGTNCEPAVITLYKDEICLMDGVFVRYPDGVQQ